jgi:hypothetical protein
VKRKKFGPKNELETEETHIMRNFFFVLFTKYLHARIIKQTTLRCARPLTYEKYMRRFGRNSSGEKITWDV